MQILLISKSHRVTRAHLEMMSAAIMALVNDRFGPTWGLAPITAAPAEGAQEGTTPCLFAAGGRA